MGCDGGTIPTRDELVRLKKKPERKDKDCLMIAKWKYCALSQEPLCQPVVACELGRLYNKDKLIEFLLDRSKFEEADNFKHIRGLKDVKELKFTDNPDQSSVQANKGDAFSDKQTSQYICPISGLEMSGKYRFCYLLKCGCVFSHRALKEVNTDICHKCGVTVGEKEVITLNPIDEELETAHLALQYRRQQAKLSKKSKKHKVADDQCTKEEASGTKVAKTENQPAGTSGTSSKPAATVSKLANGDASGHRSKLINGQSSKGAAAAAKPKSIQEDPAASKTYKSLFTTCDKAKNQPKNNWVTYNPCFY